MQFFFIFLHSTAFHLSRQSKAMVDWFAGQGKYIYRKKYREKSNAYKYIQAEEMDFDFGGAMALSIVILLKSFAVGIDWVGGFPNSITLLLFFPFVVKTASFKPYHPIDKHRANTPPINRRNCCILLLHIFK